MGRPWLVTVDSLSVIDSSAAGTDGGGGVGAGAGAGGGVGVGAGVGAVGLLLSHADVDITAARRSAAQGRMRITSSLHSSVLGPKLYHGYQSHAAPRTPLVSPCAARTNPVRGVSDRPAEKTNPPQKRGTFS